MASPTRLRRTHSVIVAGALGVWLVGGLSAHAAGARLAIQIPRTNMIVAIHPPADAPPEVASVASVDSVAIVQTSDRTVVSAGTSPPPVLAAAAPSGERGQQVPTPLVQQVVVRQSNGPATATGRGIATGSQATVAQTITISQAAADVSVLGSARGGGVVATSSQHASTVQSGGAASAALILSGAP